MADPVAASVVISLKLFYSWELIRYCACHELGPLGVSLQYNSVY